MSAPFFNVIASLPLSLHSSKSKVPFGTTRPSCSPQTASLDAHLSVRPEFLEKIRRPEKPLGNKKTGPETGWP
jgi:hypothetical protein